MRAFDRQFDLSEEAMLELIRQREEEECSRHRRKHVQRSCGRKRSIVSMKTWKKTRKGGAEREQKGVWGETAGKIRREDLEEYA